MFSMRRIVLAALITLLPAIAVAQQFNPSGIWRCVRNGPYVSIDVTYQLAPDQRLFGQGSIVYVNTGRIFNIQGPGRWNILPPDASSSYYAVTMQMQPQNHAIFSILAWIVGDPNAMFSQFPEQATGQMVQTHCARVG